MSLLQSPLHDRHVALGAKLAEFGGWEMPLEYAGGGVLAEHKAVRESVGVFDVSHLGKATVRGPGALAYLNSCLTADLGKIGPGQAQYTVCCDDDGGAVDDLIAYVHGDDHVFLIPNAANTAEVVRRLVERVPAGIEIENRHEDFVVLAVQGPASDEVLSAMGLPVAHDYMSFDHVEFDGQTITVCRTGYTGERGYELVAPSAVGAGLWDAVVAAGKAHEIRACGLGARDTLRTEMGYPLHGQDLSRQISPVMARAGWAVGWAKPAFWGKAALEAQKAELAGGGDTSLRVSRGVVAEGRGIPRPGMVVRDGDGSEIGSVTSGTFSPTLRTGIALALLAPSAAIGDQVSVDVRNRSEAFSVVKPPFVEPSTR